jgi:drug/metabolite transporter (DMT)-like permease
MLPGMNRQAVLYALAAAALFGLSTPAAKVLLGHADPWILAGVLYTGAGLGLALVRVVLGRIGAAAETALSPREIPWLAAAVLAGGVAGPVLLMIGLARTDASAASLLLTLEGVATALMAWFVFRENFDRRIAAGMLCIVAGAAVLGWRSDARIADLLGPLAIAAACVAWAVDNNLTRKIAQADPIQIAMIKGLVAGPVNLTLGLLAGASTPTADVVAVGGLTGFLGYGLSLALFVAALRHLGTARTAAYFSVAPFVGAAAAVPLLGEEPTPQLFAAGALMAVGVWLHLSERHEHEHLHEAMAHAHRHVHDAHHRHRHGPGVPPGEPHSHWHAHASLRHAHPHAPDIHHRHPH